MQPVRLGYISVGITHNIKPIGTVQYWLIPNFVGSSNDCQAVNHTVAVYTLVQYYVCMNGILFIVNAEPKIETWLRADPLLMDG